jgi:hypothetical protein
MRSCRRAARSKIHSAFLKRYRGGTCRFLNRFLPHRQIPVE